MSVQTIQIWTLSLSMTYFPFPLRINLQVPKGILNCISWSWGKQTEDNRNKPHHVTPFLKLLAFDIDSANTGLLINLKDTLYIWTRQIGLIHSHCFMCRSRDFLRVVWRPHLTLCGRRGPHACLSENIWAGGRKRLIQGRCPICR